MHINAHRQDTESWRVSRLHKAVDTFCAVFGVTREQADVLIRAIQDRKGELFVDWHHEPTDRQREAMAIAWGICGETNVHHAVDEGL